MKEFRAIEQQIAQKMGEWLTKTAVEMRADTQLDLLAGAPKSTGTD